MISLPRPRNFIQPWLAVCLLASIAASGQPPQPAPAPVPQPSSAPSVSPSTAKALTPAEFAARLAFFDQLTAACQLAPSADHCPASQVDLTLELQLSSGRRPVSFLWLRAVLEEAAHPPKSAAKSGVKEAAKPRPGSEEGADELRDHLPSIQDRLTAARQRLLAERAQVLAPPSATSDSASGSRRRALAAILAGKDYHAINPDRTLRQRILEKIQQWLLRFFSALREAGRGKRWIGIAVEAAFLALLLVVLAWFLIRLERQGRFINASLSPALGAASARDWQLWLEDAHLAAARHAWRDAVHYLYWSSISRLESSGLWPADRARTPREYLALLAPTHTQRAALLDLTRTFERTWYAGRPASEADFLQAQHQANQLGTRRSDSRSTPQLNPADPPPTRSDPPASGKAASQ